MSCDKFSIVWDIWHTLFRKFWPDFDGPVYMCAETATFREPSVTSITTGLPQGPSNWSEGLEIALNKIETPFVIMTLEDLFLNRPVKHNKVKEMLALMKADPDIGCLRLVPVPPGDIPVNEDVGKMSAHSRYRISTQTAIWRRDYLLKVLKKGESPWEFEHIGSERSNTIEGEVYATLRKPADQRLVTHLNGIMRGKMMRQSENFLKANNIPIPESVPVNTWLEEFYWMKASERLKKLMDFVNHRFYKYMGRHKL